MSEKDLKQPWFIYSACGPFTKNKNPKIKKIKELMIYLSKRTRWHSMTYGDFKDLARRAASEKVLWDKALVLQMQNMMDIKDALLQWFINFFIKTHVRWRFKNENMLNQKLVE